MKRAIGLITIVIACIVGFLSIRGAMPFMPIFGSSMEPELQSGSLLLIEPVDPDKIKTGDIIVYNVPSMVREHYNYPPTIAHRVIKVNRGENLLSFRTKGDNTGEDPFSILPGSVRGKVGNQIPYMGFPLLFLQSSQGLIFIVVALSLLALFLYSDELNMGRAWAHRGIFSPVIKETNRYNRVLTEKIESTEQKVNSTERALEKFATAIEAYAQHLASHTSAIQGLSEASQELKKSSAEQNRVLMHLMESMGKGEARPEAARPEVSTEEFIDRMQGEKPPPEQAKPEAEEPGYPPGCFRSRRAAREDDTLHAG